MNNRLAAGPQIALEEADAMADAGDAKLPDPSPAPHAPDQACCVWNPLAGTWSLWRPGDPGWAVMPAEEGADAIGLAQRAPNTRGYSVWRVVKHGNGAGVTPFLIGSPGQGISDRAAHFLRRQGALDPAAAVQYGVVQAGRPPAAEPPARLSLTVNEKMMLPTTPMGPVIRDASPMTDAEAPPIPGEVIAQQTPLGGMGQVAPGGLFGGGIVRLGLLGAVGWGIWKWWEGRKKSGGEARGNPKRRRSSRRSVRA